jgi:2'-5' RNA ligase
MGHIRTFIAVKISYTPEIRRVYNQIRKELKEEDIKWVDPEKLHITMKFIGETDEREIPLMVKRLKEAAVKSKSFRMLIRGCGVFPKISRPKVLWMGLDYPEEMLELKGNIEGG